MGNCNFEIINDRFICKVCDREWFGEIAPVIACTGEKPKKRKISPETQRAKAAAIQRKLELTRGQQQPLKKGCGCKGK